MKPTPIIPLILLAVALATASCSRKETAEPQAPANDIAKTYATAGFTLKARLNSYTPLNQLTYPGYFIRPLDIRMVGGVLKAAYNSEEFPIAMPQGRITTWFGTVANGSFSPTTFAPCGDPSVNSDYDRVIRYEVDGQGNLFTSYRWRDNNSASLTWAHSFCCSNGLNSQGEQVDYPIEVSENNAQATGIGGMYYNGLEMPMLKSFVISGGTWTGEQIPGLLPELQGYASTTTTSGNRFLAYTARSSGEFGGSLNLLGYSGLAWVNLGSFPAGAVRRVAGINISTYYEPFPIRFIRNGENPWILLFREDNTLAAFRFDGTALQQVADNVPFPYSQSKYQHFCVFHNKLITSGTPGTGLLDNKQAVYQLEGNSFALLKIVEVTNFTVTGTWSDNQHLWVTGEIFTAENGFFHAAADLLEFN